MIPRILLLAAVIGTCSCAAQKTSTIKPGAAEPTAEQKMEKLDAEFEQFESEYGGEKGRAKPVRDPLSYFNRGMFWFNDKFYFWVAKPLLIGYDFILPQFARTSVNNAFNNIKAPLRMVNNALEGRFKASGTELARLIVNSTLGVGGLWDPSDRWFKIRQVDADFGQTLGHYGVGYGFPIVLPFLGQTNLRDGIGLFGESFVDPVWWVTDFWTFTEVSSGGKFNFLSLHREEYEKIRKEALDPYTFMRDAHIQYRESRIKASRGEK